MAKKAAVGKVEFERGLARLEEIAVLMEDEATGLNECVALYDEGVKIAVKCREALDAAELRVAVLRGRLDGGFDLSEGEL